MMNRSVWALLTTLLLFGCMSNRLDGPLYLADDPPWIAGAQSHAVAPAEVVHRVVLIGDAGYYLEDDQTLAALGRWTTEVESTAVFLGDNIYNEGLVDDDRERGEPILAQQLAATPVRKIVIPGNHDWGFSPKGQNAKAIQNQQAFVDEWTDGSAEFIPKDGCMGPEARILHPIDGSHPAVVLVTIDPTPWINERLREACPQPETPQSSLALLESILAQHAQDHVVVVSHYPMLTGGPHGGLTYGFPADMFIGVIGWSFGGLGNTYEPAYADWIARTQEVFRRHPPLIYAAGHDHSLQILEAGDVAGAYVVSGAGARDRVSTVTHLSETVFAHAAPGFVVVDFARRGDENVVVLRVVEAGHEGPVFEVDLPLAAPNMSQAPETPAGSTLP